MLRLSPSLSSRGRLLRKVRAELVRQFDRHADAASGGMPVAPSDRVLDYLSYLQGIERDLLASRYVTSAAVRQAIQEQRAPQVVPVAPRLRLVHSGAGTRAAEQLFTAGETSFVASTA